MPEGFTLVDEFVAPGTPGRDGHLLDYETQQFVTSMWRRYIAAVRDDVDFSRVQPVLRRVSYSLESEALPGERLTCGIRVAGRTRRSCTFAGVLSHSEDGRPIHVAQMVMVFLDTVTRTAVEVPTPIWAAIERLEGRSIPIEASPTR